VTCTWARHACLHRWEMRLCMRYHFYSGCRIHSFVNYLVELLTAIDLFKKSALWRSLRLNTIIWPIRPAKWLRGVFHYPQTIYVYVHLWLRCGWGIILGKLDERIFSTRRLRERTGNTSKWLWCGRLVWKCRVASCNGCLSSCSLLLDQKEALLCQVML
jgi:hypothetical protein